MKYLAILGFLLAAISLFCLCCISKSADEDMERFMKERRKKNERNNKE